MVRGDLSTAASEIPAMLNAARLVGDDASSSDRLQAVMRAATGVSKSHRALFLAENLLAVLLVHLRAAPGAVSSNAITEESDSGESKVSPRQQIG